MRVAAGGVMPESTSFLPRRTTLAELQALASERAAMTGRCRGPNTLPGGFIDACEPIADSILLVDTPNWGPADLRGLPCRHVSTHHAFCFADAAAHG